MSTLVASRELPVPSTLLPPVELEPPGAAGSWFDTNARSRVRAMTRTMVAKETGGKKLSQCGLPISAKAGGPGLILTEGARMYGGQVVACQSPLRCAWCGPMQWDIASRTGQWYANRTIRCGGWLAHTALTIPHGSGDDLADLLRALAAAWAGLRKNRALQRLRAQAKVITAVPVLQITWSARNGWHPHLHVVWYCLGDPAVGEALVGTVAQAWHTRVGNVMASVGGRRPRSPSGSGGSLVQTVHGLWVYLAPDHELHPDNDCRHLDHPGCERCWGDGGGGVIGDGPGGPLDDDGPLDGSGDRDLLADFFDSPAHQEGSPFFEDEDPEAPGREILSQIGADAVAGDKRAGAIMKEYLAATVGGRRIVSGWRELRARFGPPPVEEFPKPTVTKPRRRVWLQPFLVAAVELRRRSARTGWMNDGLRAAVDDPWAAADQWSQVLDRTVEVRRHREDGAPVIGVAGEWPTATDAISEYPRSTAGA